MTKNILEIACFNLESAIVAAQNGADRIELCEDYSVGGITPRPELIQKIKSQLKIPVYVMIRPRGGDFSYSSAEFETMKSEVKFCKENKVEGVVFGLLTMKGELDKGRCQELVNLAKPLSATFHRAFDEIKDSMVALEEVIECGFGRILTSGSKRNALEGAELILELIKKSDNRIIIMPGGGLRSENILRLKQKTGATEFHSAAIVANNFVADGKEIGKMKSILLS